jgi:hypothetical protein
MSTPAHVRTRAQDPDETDAWAGLKNIGSKLLNFGGVKQQQPVRVACCGGMRARVCWHARRLMLHGCSMAAARCIRRQPHPCTCACAAARTPQGQKPVIWASQYDKYVAEQKAAKAAAKQQQQQQQQNGRGKQ